MLKYIHRLLQPNFKEPECYWLRSKVVFRHYGGLIKIDVHILFDLLGLILDFPVQLTSMSASTRKNPGLPSFPQFMTKDSSSDPCTMRTSPGLI